MKTEKSSRRCAAPAIRHVSLKKHLREQVLFRRVTREFRLWRIFLLASVPRKRPPPCSQNANPCERLRHSLRRFRATAAIRKAPTRGAFLIGDPYGNRTHAFAVRGRRLSRLTNGPFATVILYHKPFENAIPFSKKIKKIQKRARRAKFFPPSPSISQIARCPCIFRKERLPLAFYGRAANQKQRDFQRCPSNSCDCFRDKW